MHFLGGCLSKIQWDRPSSNAISSVTYRCNFAWRSVILGIMSPSSKSSIIKLFMTHVKSHLNIVSQCCQKNINEFQLGTAIITD